MWQSRQNRQRLLVAVAVLICSLGTYGHSVLQRYPGVLGGGEEEPQGADGPAPWKAHASHERMPLHFFDRVLLTSSDTEFEHSESMFTHTLDFQWAVLRQSPTKAAPYLVCSRYAQGRGLASLLREGLPSRRRVHTVHSSRTHDATCFIIHAHYDYARKLVESEGVRYVEPVPSSLKISPGAISYSSQQVDGGLGGSASTVLKFAQLGQHDMADHTPAPTPAPTAAPRSLRRAGPELIVTFAPGAKASAHVRALLDKWKMVLPKLGHFKTGGFQERFFWAAASAGTLPQHQQDDYNGRTAAWNNTLETVKQLYHAGGTCGFEHVVFKDESDNHVVVGNLTEPSPPPSPTYAYDAEITQHACLVSLNAFLASHPDVLSIQTRARYASSNAQAAWIIQSGDRVKKRTPLWDLGLTGKGEVIGVSDTGLDDEGCYFYDKKRGRVARSTWDRPVTDMKQRKVVQYVSFVDGGDLVEGHGTHVSASIAGLLEDDWAMHQCQPHETLACTGMCLSEDECRISQFDYHGCGDWKHDGSCDTWFSCPMHNCDGGDCKVGCNEDPHEALSLNVGMAREAKLAFFDIADEHGNLSTPSDFHRMLFPSAYAAGARIHSNSWGINIKGYLFDDMKIDQYAYEHQDFLIIYAAGNYGQDGFHSIGSPGTTKNALTIGATESGPQRMTIDIDYVAKFSSRGPTHDGRLKPDVVAPGSYIYSARSAGYNNGGTCSYVAMAGTSMAAPIVAGTAALLRQYFKEGFYATQLKTQGHCSAPYMCRPFEPSAPLLKALFVNSAVPVSALRVEQVLTPLFAPPDLVQGHGRVEIESVMDFGNGSLSLFVADEFVASEGDRTFLFHVTDDSRPFQVTLAWIDPPNAFNARKQLLHDLDLLVLDQGGHTLYHPNGLPGPDEKNNVEKVYIKTPKPQVYRVVVKAGSLSEAETQRFGLALTAIGHALPSDQDPSTFPSPPLNGIESQQHNAASVAEKIDAALHQQEQQAPVGYQAFTSRHAKASPTSTSTSTSSSSSSSSSTSTSTSSSTSSSRNASLWWSSSSFGGGGVGLGLPLHEVLDPCFTQCMDSTPSSTNASLASMQGHDSVCKRLSVLVGERGQGECGAVCPEAAVREARELCLGYGCDLAECGVFLATKAEQGGKAEQAGERAGDGKRYKVHARLILRGVELESFNTSDVTMGLAEAVARWLQINESSVRVEHVNGYRLDSSGLPRRRLFVSRMLPHYGVEVGVTVHVSGRSASSGLRLRMGESYGHLTSYLHHAAGHNPRRKALRRALVFDLESHVITYKVLPDGLAYDVTQEEEPPPPPPPLYNGDTTGALLILVAVPMVLLAVFCGGRMQGGGEKEGGEEGRREHKQTPCNVSREARRRPMSLHALQVRSRHRSSTAGSLDGLEGQNEWLAVAPEQGGERSRTSSLSEIETDRLLAAMQMQGESGVDAEEGHVIMLTEDRGRSRVRSRSTSASRVQRPSDGHM